MSKSEINKLLKYVLLHNTFENLQRCCIDIHHKLNNFISDFIFILLQVSNKLKKVSKRTNPYLKKLYSNLNTLKIFLESKLHSFLQYFCYGLLKNFHRLGEWGVFKRSSSRFWRNLMSGWTQKARRT